MLFLISPGALKHFRFGRLGQQFPLAMQWKRKQACLKSDYFTSFVNKVQSSLGSSGQEALQSRVINLTKLFGFVIGSPNA